MKIELHVTGLDDLVSALRVIATMGPGINLGAQPTMEPAEGFAVIRDAKAREPAPPVAPKASDMSRKAIGRIAKEAEEAAKEIAEIDYVSQIQKPMLAYAAMNGRDSALKLLEEFNAASAKDVPKKAWPQLAARLAELNQ